MLRTFFPLAFQPKNDIVALIINIIIHIFVDAVVGVVIGLLADLPLVGAIVAACGSLIGLYFTISLVLSILHFLKVVK